VRGVCIWEMRVGLGCSPQVLRGSKGTLCTMVIKKFKEVIFVCTANYYRSRFSEYLFNALARKHDLRWRATSRGLMTWTVRGLGPIYEGTADRLTAIGIPFDADRLPAQLAQADLERADLVVAMKMAEHHAMMMDQFPEWADRIEYWHVDDLDCATPDQALPICEECVRSLVRRLSAEQEASGRLRRAG
jgi:protein-tyrosine phosphatase